MKAAVQSQQVSFFLTQQRPSHGLHGLGCPLWLSVQCPSMGQPVPPHLTPASMCEKELRQPETPGVFTLQENDVGQVRGCSRDLKPEEGRGLEMFAGTRASTLFLCSWLAFFN